MRMGTVSNGYGRVKIDACPNSHTVGVTVTSDGVTLCGVSSSRSFEEIEIKRNPQ